MMPCRMNAREDSAMRDVKSLGRTLIGNNNKYLAETGPKPYLVAHKPSNSQILEEIKGKPEQTD